MTTRHYTRQIDKKPGKDPQNSHWSDKQKYEAVALYRLVGSLRAVANTLGIPEITVKKWHLQDWWKEYEEEVRQSARAELTGKMKKVADKAIKVVEDRLENGEWIFDQKRGELKRRPIGAHVANQILKDSVDRQILIEKLQREDKKEATQEQIGTRLMQLHEEFARFSKAKTISQEGGDPTSTPFNPVGGLPVTISEQL